VTETWWTALLSLGAGLVLAWLLLVAVLLWAARGRSEEVTFKEVLRLLPDILRLVRGLAGDRSLPRTVRWRLWLLLAYLLLPIDLVPDFLPVIGYADDAIVIALVLRSVARSAGSEALQRHWRGSSAGLAAVGRLLLVPVAATHEESPG